MSRRGEEDAVQPKLGNVNNAVKAQEDERVAATSRVPVSREAEVLAIPEHSPRPVPVPLVASDVAERVVEDHQPVVRRVDDRPRAIVREIGRRKRI